LRNVDYRVSMFVNERLVLQTTDDDYAPDPSALRKHSNDKQRDPRPIATATIAASRLNLELRHVAFERDIYYRSTVFSDDGRREPVRSLNPWLDHPGWASTGNPLLLESGEYMMLGDNSPQSQDSRLWWKIAPALQTRPDYQLGTVPEDQIIGRAFFVYWPAGYRAWWVFNRGLIPNVGEMRWIR
jgi:signal peptidase I